MKHFFHLPSTFTSQEVCFGIYVEVMFTFAFHIIDFITPCVMHRKIGVYAGPFGCGD